MTNIHTLYPSQVAHSKPLPYKVGLRVRGWGPPVQPANLEQMSCRYRVFVVEGRRPDIYQPGPKAQVMAERN